MNSIYHDAVFRILRALVRILLRKGVALGEFNLIARKAYVEVAEEMLLQQGEKPTTSRIAVATGMTRKDVAQLRQKAVPDLAVDARYNRGVGGVNGWSHDPDFLNADGEPLPLPLQGAGTSFESLVSRYSGDMPFRAVLRELEQGNVVQGNEQGLLVLTTDAYIPHADEQEQFAILGQDVGLLIKTIEHNLQAPRADLQFQRKVCYDNLPPEVMGEFRQQVNESAMHLLLEYNDWLARHDRDAAREVDAGSGRVRAGVGIYYFEEPVVEPDRDAPETAAERKGKK